MSKLKLIFERQLWHYLLLPVLLTGLVIISSTEGFLRGDFLNVGTKTWFLLAVAIPILHQFYVWFCWRMQLHYSLITRLFGRAGFICYSIIFLIFLISRLTLLLFLAISNKNSLDANPILLYGLSIVFWLLALYVFYSILKYFTLRRAMGVDHFDPSYRGAGLVRKGVFRYTSNAMYTVGLLFLWIPGLLFSSKAALAVVLFSHIYVWIHYYCTEKPDMRKIYGLSPSSENE
ncbi:MAG: methyltransferase [Candidatus Zixiibacteriota bacterium]